AKWSRWRDRWETVGQDLGYVLRSLRRSPGFFAAVSLTFALGIGANAAVFSVLDRLFLAVPPGVVNPSQIRRIVRQDTAVVTNPSQQLRPVFAYPEFRDIAATSSGPVVGYDFDVARLGRGASTTDVGVTHVLGDYFGMLGVNPALGRFFSPDEERIDAPQSVAVISQRFRGSHFGGQSDIVGQQMVIDGRPYTVIGAVRGAFHGVDQDVTDIWLPMNTEGWGRSAASWDQAHSFWIRLLARVPSPTAAARLTQSATVFFRQHAEESPGHADGMAMLAPLVEPELPGDPAPGVAIATRLAAMALIILVIACANVANLFLARGLRRRQEIAVRLALGIGRRRLMLLLLAESAAAAAIGAVLAVVIAFEGGAVLRRMVMPETRWGAAGMDRHALLFTLSVAVVAAFAAGLLPALRASRPDVARELKIGARGGVRQRSMLRTALAVTQAALSVILLAGAGFLIVSLRKVEAIPTGYQPDRTLFASVHTDPGYANRGSEIDRQLPQLAATLKSLPGVEATGLTANTPMYAMNFVSVSIPGRDSLPLIGGRSPYAFFVSRSYFDAVGVRLLQGHLFRETDRYDGAAPVVVNQTMARTYWPGASPLGRCLMLDKPSSGCSTVIGVVADTHEDRIIEPDRAMQFYVPLADTGFGAAGVVAIRAAPGHGEQVAAAVRRRLADEFAGWAEPQVRVMSDYLDRQLQPWRTGATLFSAAGLLALLVAMVGIYSTISYTFSQRTHEIGVRMALGAGASIVLRLVVGEGVRIVIIGVVIGVLLALAGGRLIASLLYDTSPHDPLVLAAVSLTLVVIAVAACLVPAWRALRTDPVEALRAE
ncbi:MAG: ADOP family duplicated permease, partial [Gemmatimonadales bacterium]